MLEQLGACLRAEAREPGCWPMLNVVHISKETLSSADVKKAKEAIPRKIAID
jgi:hypothetical protein